MNSLFLPEGARLATRENHEYVSSPLGLERAMHEGATVEGIVTLCDGDLRLHVDLQCATGIIEPEEAVYCRTGESRKDIAIITRVGKPICAHVTALENRDGRLIAKLSRKSAQRECMRHLLSERRAGDILSARVTHLEPFGAFLDVGCGIASLLSVDCISVSRIAHPRDRLRVGMPLSVVIKSMDTDAERIYVSLRELLGTWEENAAHFRVGQTVTGILRSVESYGVFVELAPNLAGLAELRAESADELRERIGSSCAVYIKSILPERMKIKLVLIDSCFSEPPSKRISYYVDPETTPHLSHWRYSPLSSGRVIETCFDQEH